MKISILTAFPDLINSYLGASVLGRGIAKGRLEVEVIDIRDFAEGSYRQIDDYSYGSGGMVLMPGPLQKALDSLSGNEKPFRHPGEIRQAENQVHRFGFHPHRRRGSTAR